MAEPLKELINRKAVGRLGRELAGANPDFDQRRFVRRANRPLDQLELKDRVRHIATILRETLSQDIEKALDQIVRSLPEPLNESDELTSNFLYWPYCHFVEEFGPLDRSPNGSLRHLESSFDALYELTQRFSAEWAIRPFLTMAPNSTFDRLDTWSRDASHHVRRLCSEGTRPYLPWGSRLPQLISDPTPVLPLLDRLSDDPSLYVRRSVANHVNDISRHAPKITRALCAKWADRHSKELDQVVRQGLRTLIKKGDREALAILGYGRVKVKATLTTSAAQLKEGDSLILTLDLENPTRSRQKLLLDYAVHFVKADGSAKPKVFKWRELALDPGETIQLSKTQSFRKISTRRHYPGAHRFEAVVNGAVVAEASVQLG